MKESAIAVMAVIGLSMSGLGLSGRGVSADYESRSAAVEPAEYVTVKPYVRRDGTYVRGHIRTAPDGNPYNNLGRR